MYTIDYDYDDANGPAIDIVDFADADSARTWALANLSPHRRCWVHGPGFDMDALDWANGLPPHPSLTPAQRRAARLARQAAAQDSDDYDDYDDYDDSDDAGQGDPFARSLDAGQGGSFQHLALMLEVRPHEGAPRRYRFALSAVERAFDLVVSVDDPTYYEVEPGEWVRIDVPLEWYEAVKARAAR